MTKITAPLRLSHRSRVTGEKAQASPARQPLRRTAHLLALEQRFMFDGAAAVDAAHVAADAAARAEIPQAPPAVEVRAADPVKDNGKKEAVIVDTSLADYKTLEAGVRDGMAIIEFDGSQNGLAQIARWAEAQSGFDAIHILSHGTQGMLELGSAFVNDAALQSTGIQAELADIGHALKSGGDLLLYGCDVAAGSDGEQFINDLSAATGADVAASTDTTGAASKGGNWTLEKQVGRIDTAALDLSGYNDTLGNVNTGNDPGAAYSNTQSDARADVAQSFTATKTGVLTSITVYGSTTSTSTLNIYSGDGTSGTLLDTESINAFNVNGDADTGTQRYIGSTLTLSSTVNITNGNKYTFQLINADGVSITYTTNSDYAGGTAYDTGSEISAALDFEFSVAQGDPVNSAPNNTVVPAISGTQKVGNALSATTGTWSDPDNDTLTYSYQWYRADDSSGTNASAIGGATASSYTLTTADAHDYVRVVVTANDGNGHTPTANSAWTAVNDSAPVDSVVPALSGTTTVGSALSTTTGTWSDADSDTLTYSYQWYRADDSSGTNASAIGSATASSYTLTSSDGDKYVRAVVTANDSHGSSNQTAASSWTAVYTVPSVSSDVRTGGASATVNTSASSVSYTVTFSESVTGVDATDFALTATGTAFGNIASVSGSGTTYTVTVDTISGDGTLRLDLNGSGTGIKSSNNVSIVSGYTSGQAYTLDHTTPNAPATPDMTSGTDTGTSNSDNITGNTTPTFTGTAESGSTVTLYDTDGTTVLGTATATGGNWSITSSALSAGSHTVTAKAADSAGNTSSASSGLALVVDNTAPTGLGLSGTTIATDNATSTSTIATFSATDGQAITYSLAAGNGTNDADNGSFTIAGTALKVGGSSLSAGTYKIYVAATDAAGNTANQAFTITIVDAPSVSSVVRAGGASATVAGSATSVNYTVTFSESVTGVDASDFALTATGTASGSIASVSGSGTTYTVTVDTLSGDGTLRLDLNSSGTGIQNGSSVDIAAGYTSGSTYTLDHTAPNAPSTPDMTSGTDSGSSSSDNITSNTTPTLTGTAESGSTVTLYDTDGTTVLGTATATGGNWSITSSTLSAGSHTVTAKATDSAGNVSSASSGLAVTIDATAPSVASVSVPADGGYQAGTTLSFTVNTSEAVTVDTSGGTPRLALVIGSSTVYANYASGSGSTALVFDYTVQAGDTDSDGIAVGALQSNGATLKDAAGNAMTLTLNSVGSTANVLVDTTAATVSSVGVPANGTYHDSQNLDFTVNFSEAVTVDTSGGTPRIALVVGSSSIYANYLSGSGTSALVFRYTTASGQQDSDGIVVGALSANGGTLRDSAGNDATLTLNSVGSTASVLVDASAPNVTDVTSTNANGSYKTGDSITIAVSFDKAVAVSGTPTIALADGGTASYSSGSGSSTLLFTYTVSAGESSADLDYGSTGALALNGGTITDAAGSHQNAVLTFATPGASGSLGANKALVIDTTAPAITFSGLALSADTGSSGTDFITQTAAQTISATLSAAPAGSDVVYGSLDNGATWTDITGKVSGTTLTWSGVTLAGSNTLKLKVSDSVGNDGTVASRSYVVDTAAPAAPSAAALTTTSLAPVLTGTASVGSGESLIVTVGGASYDVTPSGGNWSLDLASATPRSGTLALVAGSSYTVAATVTDAAGNSADGSNVLTIAVPLSEVIVPPPVTGGASGGDGVTVEPPLSPMAPVPAPATTAFLSGPAESVMSGSPAAAPDAGLIVSSTVLNTAAVGVNILPAARPTFAAEPAQAGTSAAVTLTPGGGGSFSIVVMHGASSGADGLMLNRGMSDQTVAVAGKTEISIPADAFAHTDSQALIHLSAAQANGQPLPNWVRFDGGTGKFIVQAPPGVSGELSIRIVARDAQGHEVATVFKLRVGGTSSRHSLLDPHSGRLGLSEQVRIAAASRGHGPAELARAIRMAKEVNSGHG